MKKLNSKEIEFLSFNRATKNGETPSITFQIKDSKTVTEFVANVERSKILWGAQSDLNTFRLGYVIKDGQLTISRNVGRSTFAQMSNMTLANTVLTFVFDADLSDKTDIWSGLTYTDLSEYAPLIPDFAHEFYNSEDELPSLAALSL